MISEVKSKAKNVLGEPLQLCCSDPMTGFYRTGYCETGAGDFGVHVVCAKVTERFLEYTRQQGNDLSTPVPAYHFPGLKPGDRWCLCASRWREALEANAAPPVVLSATHINTLAIIPLELLQQYAIHPEA